MAINFDNVPKTNPFTLPPKGIYRARITEAKMQPSKTEGKPPYLNVTYTLLNKSGQAIAKVYDRLFDSTHQVVLYKLGRLISAIGLELKGSVELKDLAKVLPNKMLVVEITHTPDSRDKDNRDADKAEPRIFGSEVFWPIEMADQLIPDEGTGDMSASAEATAPATVMPANADDAAALAAEIAEAAGGDDDY